MKNFITNPTFENVKKTLIDDKFNRLNYIKRFVDLLEGIDSNTSISVNASWGAGKTFFVKQVILYLIALNNNIGNAYTDTQLKNFDFSDLRNILNIKEPSKGPYFIPVYYDAWKNDSSSNSLLSIVNECIQSFYDFGKLENKAKGKTILEQITKALVSSFKYESTFVNPNNPSEIRKISFDGSKIVNTWNDLRELKNKNILRSFEEENDLHDKINKLFNDYLPEKADKMVIFIDELDRCRPLFAIDLLEKVKHFFDNDNIIFVFSTNQKELQNSIRSLYGNDFDGYRYLNKFFDLTLNLPDIDINTYIDILSDDLHFFIEKNCLKSIAKIYNFKMRDICRFFTIYNIAMRNYEKEVNSPKDAICNIYRFCEAYIIPLSIALLITDQNKLEKFLSGDGLSYLLPIMDSDEYSVSNITSAYYKNYNIKPNLEDIGTFIYNKMFAPQKIKNLNQEITKLSDFVSINADFSNLVKRILSLLSYIAVYD